MTNLPATGPNASQIEYWNEQIGPKWVALDDRLNQQIAPLGRSAMDRLGLAAGESVLDVGCGCGATSCELHERVRPGGHVTGLDISRVMLERARERARRGARSGLSFVNSDAQTHAFEPGGFDCAFSRFGVMFFSDPTAAFANLRRALRTGGRLAFVCWQGLPRNPWMRIPLAAVAPLVELPPPPPPEAPGPFAFADADRVRGILGGAGFAGVEFAPLSGELLLGGGGDLEEVVDFALQLGPASRALAGADPETVRRAGAALREALTPFEEPDGVRLEFAATVVFALNPA